MQSRRDTRLKREIEDMKNYKQFSLNIQNFDTWLVTFSGVEKTLYQGETFTLRFRFDENYVRILFSFY